MSAPRPHDDAERVLAELERAGRLQRSVLAEAAALPRQPAEERLLAALPAAAARRSRRRAWSALAAVLAAAALLLWLGLRAGEQTGPPRGGDELLGAPLELVSPRGATASFDEFRWKPVERSRWYVVAVHDAETGAEVDRSPELEDIRWQVPRERWQHWPTRIRWEVRAYDAAGRPVGTGVELALLSP